MSMGKDHLGLLMYLETRAVDNCGKVEKQRLRCNQATHTRSTLDGAQGGRPSTAPALRTEHSCQSTMTGIAGTIWKRPECW